MPPLRQFSCRTTSLILLALFWLAPTSLLAGGGPFNTLVVVNTNSADSVELGDYYAAAHGIPAHHICRLGITNPVSVTSNEFRSLLLAPITNHVATNGLAGQIDYVVLCGDFPTRVRYVEGVSASLFYGFKNAPSYGEGGCTLPTYTTNAFYRAERAFRSADGWNATNGFIAFHLIASNLPTAKLVADRGAAAQSSFPPSTVQLFFLGDAARGVREKLFPRAQFSCTSLPGLPLDCLIAPAYTNMTGQTNVMGYHDGYGNIPSGVRTGNIWLPGAYADHMTSCGGMIPDPCYGQSTILDWMAIGATASYGTVAEPCNYLAKFPDPLLGFYYARGFTIGESYAMSVEAPYQGLFAGDPLAAPFAASPMMTVTSHTPYQIVIGTIPVQVSAAARSNGAPAAGLDLHLDGRFQTNLVTVSPTRNNQLSVAVGNRTNTSTITPVNDTLFDAVGALADDINSDPAQIVSATAHGDRLELIYKQFDHAGDNVQVSASVSQGTAAALTLGVGLAATNLAPSIYPARKDLYLATQTSAGANAGDTITHIITLTNGVAVTNILVATQGEKPTNLLERLRSAINTNDILMATNGVRYDRLANSPNYFGAFFARTPGPDGAGIQIDYSVSAVSNTTGLKTNYNFSAFMQDRPDDIRARASILFHVRPTNGILAATTSLATTNLSDGIHVLDFIARDGSAVAAQSRFTLPLVVANTSCVLTVSSAHGTATPPGGIYLHPPGTILTNSVAAPDPANDTQLVCAGWAMTGNEPASGTDTNFTMTLTNHATLTWLWATNYWLDTEAAEQGSVSVADSWQLAGSTTQITAVANAYYHFTHWSGSVSSADNPLDLLMDAPKAVQANFDTNYAPYGTPEWWLAQFGWTNDFDAAETNDEPDGFPAWQEYIADTDPTNAASYPRVASIATDGTNPVVAWPASSNRVYQIHHLEDLIADSWITQQLSLGTGEWTDTNPPPATSRYYRIAPRLP
ncbi:MAG TPA: hypothetical protein DCM68_06200 [Verrucomicrobia bacterium]|nr:hypothetical protein [Verrucomicrobiota bacterium]